jgi:hypothetical protein
VDVVVVMARNSSAGDMRAIVPGYEAVTCDE